MALPRHSKELCFSTDVLLDRNFKVDDFVSQCRQQVTIERLREDLDGYFRTLKNAMVELINKDYADFVNLSANLVDMDKSITNLLDPLGKLQWEITSVKQAMEESIDMTESRLEAWTNIREQKAVLHRVVSILESVEKLERLLKITSPSDARDKFNREKFSSMVMERVAREFNKLQYNVSLTDHSLVEETKSRISVITITLQSHLESSFKVGLESRDRETLAQCLHTYASISRQAAAEDMFRNVVVYPYMDKVISAKALITHPQGLAGLYVEVLQFVPKHCSLLLEITSTERGLSGYDFVVSAVWPTIVAVLEEKASVIFAPGNPDTFHRNYSASMDFLSSFEQQCPSQHSVKRLRTHPSFTSFMSKWSLPVYFQIRFQEIAGSLESSLSLPLKLLPSNKEDTPTNSSSLKNFRLELFHTLWEAIQKCWDESVYIAALVHRLWKLTLQLIMRLTLWLDEMSVTAATETTSENSGSADKTIPLDVCLCIFNDCEELIQKLPSIVGIVKASRNATLLRNDQILKDGLCEATTEVEKLLPKYADIIVDRVAKQCILNLEPAHTIPRLFRRTNRDAPNKPSSYVSNITKPLLGVSSDFPVGHRREWTGRIVCSVSERYFSITSELLTSVKRTEDSLLKLKSYRKSLVPTSSGGLSDDNKIRLQLALDIEQYASQVATVQLEALELPIIRQLLEIGQSAKTASSTSPN